MKSDPGNGPIEFKKQCAALPPALRETFEILIRVQILSIFMRNYREAPSVGRSYSYTYQVILTNMVRVKVNIHRTIHNVLFVEDRLVPRQIKTEFSDQEKLLKMYHFSPVTLSQKVDQSRVLKYALIFCFACTIARTIIKRGSQ